MTLFDCRHCLRCLPPTLSLAGKRKVAETLSLPNHVFLLASHDCWLTVLSFPLFPSALCSPSSSASPLPFQSHLLSLRLELWCAAGDSVRVEDVKVASSAPLCVFTCSWCHGKRLWFISMSENLNPRWKRDETPLCIWVNTAVLIFIPCLPQSLRDSCVCSRLWHKWAQSATGLESSGSLEV